jgi:hypothetical protein
MNKELQELEAELQSLRPPEPSARLLARIEADLVPKRRTLLAWAGLPLPAAIAMMITVSSEKPAVVVTPGVIAPASAVADRPDIFKPIATQNVLYATEDEGIVTLTDGRKVRRVNRAYVDTVLWRNPQTNASLTWSVPRNEVQVTPVAFQ